MTTVKQNFEKELVKVDTGNDVIEVEVISWNSSKSIFKALVDGKPKSFAATQIVDKDTPVTNSEPKAEAGISEDIGKAVAAAAKAIDDMPEPTTVSTSSESTKKGLLLATVGAYLQLGYKDEEISKLTGATDKTVKNTRCMLKYPQKYKINLEKVAAEKARIVAVAKLLAETQSAKPEEGPAQEEAPAQEDAHQEEIAA